MTASPRRHAATPDLLEGLRAPAPEQLGAFVARLQRLLTGGEFVNTYKLALLIALARWAVEHPAHDESLPIDVEAPPFPVTRGRLTLRRARIPA
jgi:hypothetical protein